MAEKRKSFKRDKKKTSSEFLSEDEKGSEGDVIYSYNDDPMNESNRYEDSTTRNKPEYEAETILVDNVGRKGRRVIFYINGDPNYKGKEILISHRTFANFERLIDELNATIPIKKQVRYIFKYPNGNEIRSLRELENGQIYLVSSDPKVCNTIPYGKSREAFWRNSRPSPKDENLFTKPPSKLDLFSNTVPNGPPKMVTIISNLNRESQHKFLLNPKDDRNFEAFLEDIPHVIDIVRPPIKSLWTVNKPMKKVESFSSLKSFLDIQHDSFYAVGLENVPKELEPASKDRFASSTSLVSASVHQGQFSTDDTEEEEATDSMRDVCISRTNIVRKSGPSKEKRWTDTSRVFINRKPREFFAPSVPDPDDDGEKPNKKLILDWVYGFSGREIRNQLLVLYTGELVYCVASVVVIYDKKNNEQTHYHSHNEDISCLALHPNQRYIASGQVAGKTSDTAAHVRVWDGKTRSTYQILGFDTFNRGVIAVDFSTKSKGDLLLAIDASEEHMLSIWDWQNKQLLGIRKTTADSVVSGAFYPLDDSIIITYGKRHLLFWKVFWNASSKGENKIMKDKQSGVFEQESPKSVTSLCFTPEGYVVTGDSNGSIVIWQRGDQNVFFMNMEFSINMRRSHKRPVNSLYMMVDGPLISGGGNEIKAWDPLSFRQIKDRILPELAGAVRTIIPQNYSAKDGALFIATTRACVLGGSLQHKFKFIIQGHSEEVWAICSGPYSAQKSTFITAGHDQLVIKWSAVTHSIIWRVQLEAPCVSVAVDVQNNYVAVGTSVGRLIILRAYDGKQVTATQVGVEQINAVTFSPDCTMLAVGCLDGFIHVISINEDGDISRTQSVALKNNDSGVSQIDWSSDSRFLQTVLADYEMAYWDTENMQTKKNPRIMKDFDWATQTCCVGHSLIGPWSNLDDREEIKVVARSAAREYLVCGDNTGKISLYKYPSSTFESLHRYRKVYSHKVDAITFTEDDRYVLSSGGNDAALIQWTLSDLFANNG